MRAPRRPALPRTLLVAGASACALTAPITPARAASKHRGTPCGQRRGRTILERGVVRVFKKSGVAYGCLKGETHAWPLWEAQHNLYQARSGAVAEVNGRFVAVTASSSDQYGASRTLEVFDLRNGHSYSVASIAENEFGASVVGEPPTPGPWPLQAYALGPDGRTARLYDTYAASTRTNYVAPPTGQVVDLVGFHRFRRQLATGAPSAVSPSSLSYDGRRVGWSQNGPPEAVSVTP